MAGHDATVDDWRTGAGRTRPWTAGPRDHRIPARRPRSRRPEQPARRSSAIIDCAVYLDGVRQPGEHRLRRGAGGGPRDEQGFVWLGLHEPGAAEMADIAEAFGLHELAVEDAVKAGQRPKLEHFGDVSFLVLRTARYVEHGELTETSEVVETGQVMLFIGAEFVITVRHGEAWHLSPCARSWRPAGNSSPRGRGRWRTPSPTGWWTSTSRWPTRSRTTSTAWSRGLRPRRAAAAIQRIYQLKRELVEFKRAVAAAATADDDAHRADQPDVPTEVQRYFRDVQDHLTRTVEQVDSYDDLLNSILQARLAQVSVEQNNDMRKIAAWAAIAAVWTAIAGVYGMNFEFMPELAWPYSYPMVLLVMLASSLGLYRLFRRNGWL